MKSAPSSQGAETAQEPKENATSTDGAQATGAGAASSGGAASGQTASGAATATATATSTTPPATTTTTTKLPTPSGESIIDPVNRIEGHLKIDMEVVNGKVENAWVSGGLFRGMELVLEGREFTDAAYITQRICGVCPISHSHASSIASEKALGIEIPTSARLLRNIVEGAQFLHSHILWFYNLAALDYVDPTKALKADIADTIALADAAGTSQADFFKLKSRLENFVKGGRLSIFEGNWFDTEDAAYKLPPELDLIATAHYFEALEMQACASEISGIIGGKMPHIMTSIPGGTTFVPTEEKLDDILFRATRILEWVESTMIPDTLAIAPFYLDVAGYGQGVGQYIAWGVFDREGFDPAQRYLPAGVCDLTGTAVADPDESAITEETPHSFYKDSGEPVNPRQGVTDPAFPDGGYDRKGRYTWDKAARYNGKPYEAGGLSRLLVAYKRSVANPGNADLKFIKDQIDGLLTYLSTKAGATLDITALASTLGRTAARNIETWYVAKCMITWIKELIEAIKGGDSATFAEAKRSDGEGAGMWEAPRGALYHYTKVVGNRINKYQIIIPSTWNISPRDAKDVLGPMEKALVGVPVADLKKPIHALRTVHSFDPCVACAVHISEPATGKKFSTITSPWR
jgi:hydrogenase large subunit